MPSSEIKRSKFHGTAFVKVLQKHGYTCAGERRGVHGEPGEVWHRGGEVKPTIGGGSARFGADKVHVIDYMATPHGLPRYSWGHSRGDDHMSRDSLTHGGTAAELDAHLQKRHGTKTESRADELISAKLLEGASRPKKKRAARPIVRPLAFDTQANRDVLMDHGFQYIRMTGRGELHGAKHPTTQEPLWVHLTAPGGTWTTHRVTGSTLDDIKDHGRGAGNHDLAAHLRAWME